MNTNEHTNWLTGLLSGWGIRESWAKVIAGAIIGALAAAGLLSGCSASFCRSADGAVYSRVLLLPVDAGK